MDGADRGAADVRGPRSRMRAVDERLSFFLPGACALSADASVSDGMGAADVADADTESGTSAVDVPYVPATRRSSRAAPERREVRKGLRGVR